MIAYGFFQNILPDGYFHHITSFVRNEDVKEEVTNINLSVIINSSTSNSTTFFRHGFLLETNCFCMIVCRYISGMTYTIG